MRQREEQTEGGKEKRFVPVPMVTIKRTIPWRSSLTKLRWAARIYGHCWHRWVFDRGLKRNPKHIIFIFLWWYNTISTLIIKGGENMKQHVIIRISHLKASEMSWWKRCVSLTSSFSGTVIIQCIFITPSLSECMLLVGFLFITKKSL